VSGGGGKKKKGVLVDLGAGGRGAPPLGEGKKGKLWFGAKGGRPSEKRKKKKSFDEGDCWPSGKNFMGKNPPVARKTTGQPCPPPGEKKGEVTRRPRLPGKKDPSPEDLQTP